MFFSVAHGFFTILTVKMVNDLNHNRRKTPKLTLSTSKSLETAITSTPLFYTKRPNKLRVTRSKLFPKRQPLSQPIINYRKSTLPSSQEQHPTVPYYSTANTNHHDILTTRSDNLVDYTSVNDDTDSPIKVYFKISYLFPPSSF